MINSLELSRLYENQWVVLDRRSRVVVDSGPDLTALLAKYAEVPALTFYFAAN